MKRRAAIPHPVIPARTGNFWRGLVLGWVALVLTGCSAQYVKDGAQEKIRSGDFEQALSSLDDALAKDPRMWCCARHA
jgi:hypothetical protein